MQDHYQILGIKKNASSWKINKAFQQKVRTNNVLDYPSYLKALLILGDPDRRKFYDILLNNPSYREKSKGKEYAMHLRKFERQVPDLLDKLSLERIVSEPAFWEEKGLMFFLRILGLHLIFGDASALGFRLSALLCAGYLFIHYGFLVLLTYFDSLWFLIPLSVVVSLVAWREYKFLKKEYYLEELIKPN